MLRAMRSPRVLAALSLLLSHACEAFVLTPTAGCLLHTHGRRAAAGRRGEGIKTLSAQSGGDDGGKALFESLRARQAQLKEEEKTLLSRWRSGECVSKAALFLDDYVVRVSHSHCDKCSRCDVRPPTDPPIPTNAAEAYFAGLASRRPWVGRRGRVRGRLQHGRAGGLSECTSAPGLHPDS